MHLLVIMKGEKMLTNLEKCGIVVLRSEVTRMGRECLENAYCSQYEKILEQKKEIEQLKKGRE